MYLRDIYPLWQLVMERLLCHAADASQHPSNARVLTFIPSHPPKLRFRTIPNTFCIWKIFPTPSRPRKIPIQYALYIATCIVLGLLDHVFLLCLHLVLFCRTLKSFFCDSWMEFYSIVCRAFITNWKHFSSKKSCSPSFLTSSPLRALQGEKHTVPKADKNTAVVKQCWGSNVVPCSDSVWLRLCFIVKRS